MSRKKKNIRNRLIHHYRWLLVDEDTREAKFSIRINMLNVLLTTAILILFLLGLAYLTLKYSPLKSYFVDETASFDLVKSKKELLKLNEKIHAIEDSLAMNNLYIEHMQKVITGDLEPAEADSLMARKSTIILNDEKLKASEEDSIFRVQIAQEELEALRNENTNDGVDLLYPPVQGVITSSYDIAENHMATDIAAPMGESVKAAANGIVVFADWSPETGNTIIINHRDDIITMYKHCSKVLKDVGDKVNKGDVIAAVGNTGELTTGPHLHFELWIQGKAVDAEQYIDF